jgi:uncharacterized protein (DUF362 family)
MIHYLLKGRIKIKLSRRKFLITSTVLGLGLLIGGNTSISSWLSKRNEDENLGSFRKSGRTSNVYVIKSNDRKLGLERLLDSYDFSDFSGKSIALKANFNSADLYPASTHPDTIRCLLSKFREVGVGKIILGERSGMGNTREVLRKLGVNDLSEDLDLEVIVLDEMGEEDWTRFNGSWMHWNNGFYLSNFFLNADKVVQTCCLKTHRFGGHFTMSLKNSVGLIADKIPGESYSWMRELHSSQDQRRMIAEINKVYNVDLIVMDAIQAFSNGGPDKGAIINPNLLIACNDRVAIDAVGVAILRNYGSTTDVMKGKIFDLEQIKRAAEIGIGVSSAEDIRLIPVNDGAKEICDNLSQNLLE